MRVVSDQESSESRAPGGQVPLSISPAQMEQIAREVLKEKRAQSGRPLSVSIMGQTGVGKSSLLNALFGTNLVVGAVRPTTKTPEEVVVSAGDHKLSFWDLPGIGESQIADVEYMDLYRAKIVESDVVIWAIHSDTRSVVNDVTAFEKLLAECPENMRDVVLNKVVFALTKCDLLSPPAWIYAKTGKAGFFSPSMETSALLLDKERYFEEELLGPFGGRLKAATHSNRPLGVQDERLAFRDGVVAYSGHFTEGVCESLAAQSPGDAEALHRLRDLHRVVACSARFRFNLARLLTVITEKLELGAIGRFRHFVDSSGRLSQVDVATVREFGNIIVVDAGKRKKVFDFSEIRL